MTTSFPPQTLGSRWCITDHTKVPRDSGWRAIKTNEPLSWMTYEDAAAAQNGRPDVHLGVLMDPASRVVCIDLDDCLDDSGQIKDQWVDELLKMANSYTEISLNGRGLHLFVEGHIADCPGGGSPEIYDGSSARFIAVTGNVFHGYDSLRGSNEALKTALVVNQRQAVTQQCHQEHVCSDTEDAVRTCLSHLASKRCDQRPEWFKVMCAVKGSLEDESVAWDIFDTWSQDSSRYDEVENRKQWDSVIDPECTLGTLIQYAEEDSGAKVRVVVPAESLPETNYHGVPLMTKLMASRFHIADIPEELNVEWLAEGLIAKGHHTLLSGREKSGKSTLIGNLLKQMLSEEGGTFLDRDVQGGSRIAVLSEESQIQWKLRRETHGLVGGLEIYSRPFTKPTHHEWNQFCEAFSELLQAQGTDLLIIDPIANFAPWKDENSASDVSRSLEALDAFTTKGIAILACHHAAKHSGDPRGSTALTSRPDIILKLKYKRERSGNDTVDITDSTERILSGTGRFKEVPKTLPLAFNEIENEYVLRQSGQQRAKESSENELRCILRDAENSFDESRDPRLLGWCGV